MKHLTSISRRVLPLLRTDAGKAFVIAVLWQLSLTLIGAFFDTTLHNIFQRHSVGSQSMASLTSHTMSWDGGWYVSIAKDAYVKSIAPAFYPLFPLFISVLHIATFGLVGYAVLGLVLNTCALAVAIYALKKITSFFLPKKYAWWPVILFLTSPAAIFIHLFYSEALFCAFAFSAYMFALQRKWLLMAIMLGFLTAARLPAILFVGLCALEFMRAYDWNVKKLFNKNLLYFAIAPVGFIIYGLYLLVVRHDFLAMFHAYSHAWLYQVFNPNIFETYQKVVEQLITVFTSSIPFDEGQAVNYFLPFVGILLLFVCSVYLAVRLRKGPGIPLGVFGLASIVFFSLNSNLMSVQRYLLPCFSIYLAIALFASAGKLRQYLFYVTCYGGVLLQAYLLILFVNGYFAG